MPIVIISGIHNTSALWLPPLDCPKVKFETSVCLNTFCDGTNVQEMSLVTVTTGDFGKLPRLL